jgi:DNA-binding IclR family transcriptional regulator
MSDLYFDQDWTSGLSPVATDAVPSARQAKVEDGRARSATRAIDVFEYFLWAKRPAKTRDISRGLGIPNSSADDILKALLRRGYLSYSARTKMYSPSLRLVGLGENFLENFPWLRQLNALGRQLNAETGQTVVISVQEGNRFRVVSAVPGRYFDPERVRVGAACQLAFFHAQHGWLPTSNFAAAILAANSDVEILKILSTLNASGPQSDYSPLLHRIRKVRAQGFAPCETGGAEPAISLARWLRRSDRLPTCAVGCIGPARDGDDWRSIFAGSPLLY